MFEIDRWIDKKREIESARAKGRERLGNIFLAFGNELGEGMNEYVMYISVFQRIHHSECIQ